MTPIELLLRDPSLAMRLIPQMRQNQMDPQRQQALDMAMSMSTPLVAGAVAPISETNLMGQAAKILNMAEEAGHNRIPLTKSGITTADVAKQMPLLEQATNVLRIVGKRVGINSKKLSGLSPEGMYDLIGKVIRNKK